MSLFKILVVVILVMIMVSLFVAVKNLMSPKAEQKEKMVRNLAIRVGLSILLVVLLVAGQYLGWIEGHPAV